MGMPRTDLSNERTTMYAEGVDLVLDRVFHAPADRVWRAITSPEYIPLWWGPFDTTARVDLMDVRPGGKWRWIAVISDDGADAPFAGEYIEVTRPRKLVRSLVPDMEPFNTMPPAVETTTLDDVEGGTQVYNYTRFPSEEILQGVLAGGVSKAALDSYDRLAHLLTQMTDE
jgi:uncharacterized protein YndB with AHSA1/START domain